MKTASIKNLVKVKNGNETGAFLKCFYCGIVVWKPASFLDAEPAFMRCGGGWYIPIPMRCKKCSDNNVKTYVFAYEQIKCSKCGTDIRGDVDVWYNRDLDCIEHYCKACEHWERIPRKYFCDEHYKLFDKLSK